jgi:hypothetical protein
VPALEDRVLTGGLDDHGRATYVTGELHPQDLHTGTATGTTYPPGLTRGELNALRARRGHLLVNLFGGKGSDPRNPAWLHERVNNSTFNGSSRIRYGQRSPRRDGPVQRRAALPGR